METTEIYNTQDTIDSRDVIARIAELEGAERDEEETAELGLLRGLTKEVGQAEEWEFGLTLIRDTYFEEFAQDVAADIHGIDIMDWPFGAIDWDDAVQSLKQDYTKIDFDGATYYIRG